MECRPRRVVSRPGGVLVLEGATKGDQTLTSSEASMMADERAVVGFDPGLWNLRTVPSRTCCIAACGEPKLIGV
jgi:hypothetical protein